MDNQSQIESFEVLIDCNKKFNARRFPWEVGKRSGTKVSKFSPHFKVGKTKFAFPYCGKH